MLSRIATLFRTSELIKCSLSLAGKLPGQGSDEDADS
jgi:hypothetical protein